MTTRRRRVALFEPVGVGSWVDSRRQARRSVSRRMMSHQAWSVGMIHSSLMAAWRGRVTM